jgi:putative ABC transport system substrate-binding protein
LAPRREPRCIRAYDDRVSQKPKRKRSEAQNVKFEYRWAEGRLQRLPELATDLVHRQVSVIFAGGGAEPALAAKAATSKIPIVFANGVDPVEVGLVASLNRPGGNITGVTFLINTLGPKELEMLHDLQPKGVIAVLLNPDLATATSQSNDIQVTARALGLQVAVISLSGWRHATPFPRSTHGAKPWSAADW